MTDDANGATFRMLVELRGGLPEACDFCKKPYTDDRWPVPEEAGEWACTECVTRWRQRTPRRIYGRTGGGDSHER